MEKSSSPSPVGQGGYLKPLRSKLTISPLQGYHWTTPAHVKEIAGNPDKLRAFQAGNPSLSHLARIADITGARGQFPPGCSPIDDLRAALLAKDYELFFCSLTLWRGNALSACQSDPVITAIFEDWGKAARRGNRTARSLLERLGKALITMPVHLPHKQTRAQQRAHEREHEAVRRAVARITNAVPRYQSKGLTERQAWQRALDNFFSESRMSGKRQERVWEKLRTFPAVQALGLSFPFPRGGGNSAQSLPPLKFSFPCMSAIVAPMNTLPTTIPPASDWLDIAQADREGPFSKRSLWKFIAAGELAAFRPFKRKVLIRRSDIARLIEGTRIATPVDETLSEAGQGNG